MIKENFNLGKISWFGVGGNAKTFFKPKTKIELVDFLKANKEPIFIIGNLSNTLIRDGGLEGVCIKLGNGFLEYEQTEEIIKVGAGVLDKTFALKAQESGIGGFEFLYTIPGNIGGAVQMNAGCFGREIADVFESLEGVDFEGNEIYLTKNDISFSYRKAIFPKDIIITSVNLKGLYKNKEDVLKLMLENLQTRNETQPISGKTCGSTFKNPQGEKAWDLLAKSGANMLKCNGASFSKIHANFIINDGTATAEDIENLGESARKQVFEKFGILLEWEIKIIGNHLTNYNARL